MTYHNVSSIFFCCLFHHPALLKVRRYRLFQQDVIPLFHCFYCLGRMLAVLGCYKGRICQLVLLQHFFRTTKTFFQKNMLPPSHLFYSFRNRVGYCHVFIRVYSFLPPLSGILLFLTLYYSHEKEVAVSVNVMSQTTNETYFCLCTILNLENLIHYLDFYEYHC